MVDDTRVTIVWNKKVTDVEGAFNRDSTIFSNLCDVWDTTMLILCGVIPDLSDDVYGHSVEDYDLAVSPTTGKESGLYVIFDFSFIITCLKNALTFNIIF